MEKGEEIDVQFFASGYCTSHGRIVNPKEGRGIVRFYAVWALLRHPNFGLMVFDAGYSGDFERVTNHWPEWIYGKATPVFLNPKETAVERLAEIGIQSEDINYFVVSHFHGDHICAAADFTNAKFICRRDAFEQMQKLNGFQAVRRGILKKLLPKDFAQRTIILEDISELEVDETTDLEFYSMFKQTDIRFVHLPGHARGMLGFEFRSAAKKILYATDASWNADAFRRGIKPMRIVKLFFDSWKEFLQTTTRLKKYASLHPEAVILFTHCPETLKYLENEV